MSSGVSDQEIERELQTLRNLRRRSASSPGPGALAVDPDLPPPSPTSAASNSPSLTSNDDITLSTPDGLDDGGLFWVPAHLHPELAPGEFRNFLKQHTHDDPEHANAEDAGEAAGLQRNPSWLARSASRRESLGRKRSMLSKQYHPKAGDNVEEEVPPMPSRERASIYGGRSGDKGLTLQDLQKLEAIVDQADEEGDPDAVRSMLRRTLSTNRSPGFLDESEEGDAHSLTRPNSILRRSARTRIRKANLPGDGGGHRFASTRKGRRTAAPDIDIPEDDWDGRKHSTNTSDESAEYDSQDHGTKDSGEMVDEDGTRYYDAPQHLEERRGSDSTDDAGGIFDAYRQSRSSSASSESHSYEGSPSNEDSPPEKRASLPQLPQLIQPDPIDWFQDEGEKTPTQERPMDPLAGSLGMRRTESGPGLSLHLPDDQPSLGSGHSPTSPKTPQQRSKTLPTNDLPPGMAAPRNPLKPQPSKENIGMIPVSLDTPRPPLVRVDSPSTKEKEKEKEKEKRGGFFSKKDKSKDKDKEKEKSKKEKDGFLGSLFGGKKKTEEPSTVSNFSSDGRAAAAALLGTSKSAKSVGLSGHQTPSPTSPGFSNFARYPIHVERAIYRLSHIKLANARRPLFEQVLISNLMFWYLGVIGRNVAEEKKPNSTNGKEGGEDKEVKLVAKGTPIKPADSGSAGTPLPRDPPQQPAVRERRTGLSKPERSRSGRDHEAPIKAPSYGSQNAQVEHEVRTATSQVQNMSIKSRPSQPSPPLRDYQPPQQQHPPPPQQQPPQHLSHTQGQPQQQRSLSQPGPVPGPQRAMSPPSPSQQAGFRRPSPDGYPANPQAVPVSHSVSQPVFQGPPRGAPQSSFGPPPPAVNGQPPLGPPNGHGPTPPFDDRRQRTMSQPGQASGHLPPPAGNMRRVVTDGRSPSPHNPYADGGRVNETRLPQHGGPQPGQLFQYPGTSASVGGPPPPPPGQPFQQRPQPGQVYSPQPGQVFQRPPPSQYSPNPQHQQLHQQQQPPYSPNSQGHAPPPGWQPGPQRLPAGASHPQHPQQHQQPHPDYGHLNRQLSHPPRDPRQLDRPQNMQYQPQHPSQQQPPPQQYHPQGMMSPSHPQGPGFYQQQQQRQPGPPGPAPGPGQSPQPGQMYSPQPGYGGPPDGYRRQQPVPPAQYGAHHR